GATHQPGNSDPLASRRSVKAGAALTTAKEMMLTMTVKKNPGIKIPKASGGMARPYVAAAPGFRSPHRVGRDLAADCLHPGFQGQAFQRVERQRQQQLDAAADQHIRIAKCLA